MFLNKTSNASYNFLAPYIPGDADKKVEVPFPTVEKITPTTSATTAVDINKQVTIIDLGTLASAITLNATVANHVGTGAMIHIKAKSDATARDITLGTGFTAPALAGVIGKTKVQSFIYDGTSFLPTGASLQID